MTYAFMMIDFGPVGIHVRRQGTGGAAKETAQEQSLAQKYGIAHRRHQVKDEHTQGKPPDYIVSSTIRGTSWAKIHGQQGSAPAPKGRGT